MRVAYADPPYLGQAKIHYGKQREEVNFEKLIEELSQFDAWALSIASNQIRDLLPICPKKTRVAVWCKPYATFKKGVNPTYAWEPVLYKAPMRSAKQKFVHDFLVCSPPMKSKIVGQKPMEFCFWVFELLGLKPTDSFVDMFPGSDAVGIAHDWWTNNYFDGEYKKLDPKRDEKSVRDTVGKI